jgi:hemoglobin/transferrin/lactoferrin receptor protein
MGLGALMRGHGGSANALLYGVSVVALMSVASGAAKAQTVLDTISVIATKTEENVWSTLAPVSAIRADDLNRMLPTQTPDVFFGVPGVSFQGRADDPGISLNIRGLQDFGRVAVVIDGARQNFQRSGHQADGQFYLDPEMIGGVDVVRGPTSNIYGSGAIGGVASFRTKDVEDVLKPGQRWGVLTNGMIGSNTFQRMGSSFGAARPNENVDIIAGGVYRERDDYKDGNGETVQNSAQEMASGLAKLTVRPMLGHELKFTGLTSETRYENGTPNATNTATVFNSTVTNNIATARWRYHRPEDRLFDFDANVYWTTTELDQNKVAGTNNPSSGLIGSNRGYNLKTIGTDVNNTSRFDTGDFRHALTIGGDVFKDTVDNTDITGSGDLFTPDGERTVGGGFAQLKTNYSSWLEIISALRYDTYDLMGSNGTGSSGDRFSPKVTVGLTPVQWLTVYGSYAEAYRAPAITEVFVAGGHPVFGAFTVFDFLQNPSLRPEVGKNKEIGVNLRFDNLWATGDALRLKANLFRNDLSDFIEQINIPSGGSGVGGIACTHPIECVQFQNIPSARIEGFELESRYDAGFWFLNASYTALEGTNEITNQPLAKIPADTFAGTLGFRFLDRRLTTAINLLSVAPKNPNDIPGGPADPAFPPVSGYNIVNLFMSYQLNDDMLFSAAVENLFDAYYTPYTNVTTITNAVVPSPSPGMTFKAGLKVRFGDTFYKGG